MVSQDHDYLFKILIVGPAESGKSSLLLRFSDNTFSSSYFPTIGVDFKIRTLSIDDKSVKLQVWDTSGQTRFKSITNTYYKGSHGIIILYDVTSKESFKSTSDFVEEVKKFGNEDAKIMLVGHKSDLEEKREVSTQEGLEYSITFNAQFKEASSKAGDNVNEVFSSLAAELMKSFEKKTEK
mmetsp:Transcript_41338/g.43250  ORF Transcript_41338/g.43250 Transcript_41338/m.43250 type:complete len:181 (+) Transcript_41338:15-557(+)